MNFNYKTLTASTLALTLAAAGAMAETTTTSTSTMNDAEPNATETTMGSETMNRDSMQNVDLDSMKGNLIRTRDITGGTIYTMNEADDEGWDPETRYNEVGADWNQIGEIEDIILSKEGQMIGIVGDSQNHQSIRFHEKMGFRQMGVVKNIGFKFDRWMDQVILQRSLGDGDNSPPQD